MRKAEVEEKKHTHKYIVYYWDSFKIPFKQVTNSFLCIHTRARYFFSIEMHVRVCICMDCIRMHTCLEMIFGTGFYLWEAKKTTRMSAAWKHCIGCLKEFSSYFMSAFSAWLTYAKRKVNEIGRGATAYSNRNSSRCSSPWFQWCIILCCCRRCRGRLSPPVIRISFPQLCQFLRQKISHCCKSCVREITGNSEHRTPMW